MSTLSERINELLRCSDKKAADIARHCKISRATVSAWVNGQTQKIDGATAYKVARLFGVNSEWVQTGQGKKNVSEKNDLILQKNYEIMQNQSFKQPFASIVKILDWNQAKNPYEIIDNSVNAPIATEGASIAIGVEVSRFTFALTVIDDAMTPALLRGEIVVVEPDMTPMAGDYVLALVSESLMIRELIDNGGEMLLRPVNRLDYTPRQLADGKIIGVIRGKTFIYR